MLFGSSLADGRGNAMLGVEWSKRQEVLAKRPRLLRATAIKDQQTNSTSARAHEPLPVRAGWQLGFAVADGGERGVRQSGDRAATSCRARARSSSTTTHSLFKLENQGLGFKGDIVNDPRFKIAPTNQLIENNFDLRYSSPLERYSVFGKADFKITDHVTAFTQVNFVNTWNMQVLQPSGATGGFGAQIPYGNDIYGPSLAADGVDDAGRVPAPAARSA